MTAHDYYMIQIAILLNLKHFICEFILQTSEISKSKAKYLGGVWHSAHHAIGSFIVMVFFISPQFSALLAFFDLIIHYHIDWVKMRFGPTSTQDKRYWQWLGADQFLHHLTYAGMIMLVILSQQTP